MFRRFCRRNRVVATAMSAMLVATALTGPGSCTVTVDQDLVNEVLDWANSMAQQYDSGYEAGVNPPGEEGGTYGTYWFGYGR